MRRSMDLESRILFLETESWTAKTLEHHWNSKFFFNTIQVYFMSPQNWQNCSILHRLHFIRVNNNHSPRSEVMLRGPSKFRFPQAINQGFLASVTLDDIINISSLQYGLLNFKYCKQLMCPGKQTRGTQKRRFGRCFSFSAGWVLKWYSILGGTFCSPKAKVSHIQLLQQLRFFLGGFT